MKTPKLTYEVWMKTQNGKSKLRIKTTKAKQAEKKLNQFLKSLTRWKGSITLKANDTTIKSFWYSDFYDQPIQGRHYVSDDLYQQYHLECK